jgi:hypothetical protein
MEVFTLSCNYTIRIRFIWIKPNNICIKVNSNYNQIKRNYFFKIIMCKFRLFVWHHKLNHKELQQETQLWKYPAIYAQVCLTSVFHVNYFENHFTHKFISFLHTCLHRFIFRLALKPLACVSQWIAHNTWSDTDEIRRAVAVLLSRSQPLPRSEPTRHQNACMIKQYCLTYICYKLPQCKSRPCTYKTHLHLFLPPFQA